MKRSFTYVLLLCLLVSRFSFTKEKESVFDWVRASDLSVQLSPLGYYETRTYHPGPNGGTIHVDIQAGQPVNIAMVSADDWNAFMQGQLLDRNIDFRCLREHVFSTTYSCSLPGRPMILVIRDERKRGPAAVREVDATLSNASGHQLAPPNNVLITYYRWDCIENCEPRLRWSRLSKGKYEITSEPKIYRIIDPERDGRQISVRIKSPVAVLAELVPAEEVNRTAWKAEFLRAASRCSQIDDRETFKCRVSPADGPQALVILPGRGVNVPLHLKAEVELDVAKCISNCNVLMGR